MACCGGIKYINSLPEDTEILLKAVIGDLDAEGKQVQSNNSIGDFIRVAISRDGIEIETTQAISHTDNVQNLDFVTDLENGDLVSIQLSNSQSFTGDFVEEGRIIPTPQFTFITPTLTPPNQFVHFAEKPLIVPSCLNTDFIRVFMVIEDTNGHIGTVTATGRLVEFNNGINAANPIPLNGLSEQFQITTSFGTINVQASYAPDFDINNMESVSMEVYDCEDWGSVQTHDGITNALIEDNGQPITTENNEVVFYNN